ncbi:MAG TPA: HD-GYP domain-containing protein [Phycisphaerae bacterium]|nr:HD-GYP domain-containing protein [Phycisphaerae bacterium]
MPQMRHIQINEELASLRKAVACCLPSTNEVVDRVIESVQSQIDLVFSEHTGLADDLIRAYEQLGIVFEVTRRLSTADTREDVVRLFVDSLRITYQDMRLYSLSLDKNDMLLWTDGPPHNAEEMAGEVRACIYQQRAVVKVFEHPISDVLEIMVSPVFVGDEFVCAIVFANDGKNRRFDASDMSLIDALVSVCGDLLRNYELADRLRELSIDTVKALVSAVDQKDEYTSGHSNRVGHFAKLLGQAIGLTGNRLQMLEWAALLHDVGKIGIRDDVLKKPGKLTDEEFEHIKEHPVRSYDVVKAIPQMAGALGGVRHHHERFDGRGYPDGLAGEGIPLDARIILVADVFDALTTTRSYREAFGFEKALAILREDAGKVGDPKLVPVFEELIRHELASGRLKVDANGKVESGHLSGLKGLAYSPATKEAE